jgi:hypothetical protein
MPIQNPKVQTGCAWWQELPLSDLAGRVFAYNARRRYGDTIMLLLCLLEGLRNKITH